MVIINLVDILREHNNYNTQVIQYISFIYNFTLNKYTYLEGTVMIVNNTTQ